MGKGEVRKKSENRNHKPHKSAASGRQNEKDEKNERQKINEYGASRRKFFPVLIYQKISAIKYCKYKISGDIRWIANRSLKPKVGIAKFHPQETLNAQTRENPVSDH